MQSLIEEIIRLIGWAALKLLSFGRYKGGQPSDVVAEGGLGLAAMNRSATRSSGCFEPSPGATVS